MEDQPAAARLYEMFNQLEYHADQRFSEYHPTIGPHPDFRLRLRDWLNSAVDEQDQKVMLEILCHVFFTTVADFNALYRAAFNGPITRWLIDQLKFDLLDADLDRKLAGAVETTWFCPITDSMQVAAFYHINNISGRNERPDWHSLGRFGDQRKVESFIASEGIERIVLLEDFVGSGSQMKCAIRFALSLPSCPQFLIVPLIVCPTGRRFGLRCAAISANLAFSPVLTLTEENFVSEKPRPAEDPFFAKIRELAVRLYGAVAGGIPGNDWVKPYGPFGFAHTGALTVMYSNCPDNTLPLIHHRSSSWAPIFPRSTRM